MARYILECMAFQVVFLAMYDFFLRRETFFKSNRAYLLVTYVLSLVLPWVQIKALSTQLPQPFKAYPEYLWAMANQGPLVVETGQGQNLSWTEGLLFGGMVLALFWFLRKMLQLFRLHRSATVKRFRAYDLILLPKGTQAFSFFRAIFMGREIPERERAVIILHELVHIRQWHTLDLLFFELMRVVAWFNPLVYIYQRRMAELHEFMADAQVPKEERKNHYNLLLSHLFQARNISFVNQFYTSSLIKKRIVMLQKSRSKRIWQLKYLVLAPMIMGMLLYSSCEEGVDTQDPLHESLAVGDVEHLSEDMQILIMDKLINLSEQSQEWSLVLKDEKTVITFTKAPEGSGISGPGNVMIPAKMHIDSKVLEKDFNLFNFDAVKSGQFRANSNFVPFATVEQVPVFPGCEDASDQRACFNEKMQLHITKHFNYPQEAEEQGIQGRVNAMFTIDAQGKVTNIKKRGPHHLLEDEVERIFRLLPKMEPGKSKGKSVHVPYAIPITFKLDESGFNPQAKDANYVRLQEQQLKAMPVEDQSAFYNGVPFAMVEEVPVFPGCEDAVDKRACFIEQMQLHIRTHFNYPKAAQEKGVQGRVSVLFLVDAEGNVDHIATRGPDILLEQEAERIMGRLPQMAPGRHQGKAVSVPYAIPITFKLQ